MTVLTTIILPALLLEDDDLRPAILRDHLEALGVAHIAARTIEGLYVEPTAALTLAAAHNLLASGQLRAGETNVVMLGATVATFVAIPLEDALGGWEGALAIWALVGVVATAVWIPRAIKAHDPVQAPIGRPLWRNPMAWSIAGLMGGVITAGHEYHQARDNHDASWSWLRSLTLQMVVMGAVVLASASLVM